MEKNKKYKFIIVGVLTIFICLSMGVTYHKNMSSDIVYEKIEDDEDEEEVQVNKEIEEEKIGKHIMVDLCGEVKNSGVIELDEGARLIDAINLAGGILPTADRKCVNLARVLEDGEQIYIPKIGEASEDVCNERNAKTSSKKININAASDTELQVLDGVGSVLAKRIVEYREKNGRFKDVRDIMNVAGIGDKKFKSIEEHIRTQ
ncbi:helix-hairpin-helix domain-containing protein [Lutibacter sp. B2]|nr:helix-hairpin-helix domain-containing protein [Lutibacter sp. B2]